MKTVSSRVLLSVLVVFATVATLSRAAEPRAPLKPDQKPLHVTYFFLPG